MPALFVPFRIPAIIQRFYPSYIWKLKHQHDTIFLTFDDGPTPEITEWVLEQLKLYNFKATFFLVGENAQKHPQICQKILDDGHATGNHTQNHLKGWKTENNHYLKNVQQASEIIPGNLFRPPYGRIRSSQAGKLRQLDYKIIMWSLLSHDYLPNLNIKATLLKLKRKTRAGDIIVFHDSLKARENIMAILPEYLKWLHLHGFKSQTISFNVD